MTEELKTVVDGVAMAASLALPLWNIPLIVGIQRRRSSKDISLAWTLGVWACFVLMLPAALTSADPTFKIFGIVNIVGFSMVVAQVLRFR